MDLAGLFYLPRMFICVINLSTKRRIIPWTLPIMNLNYTVVGAYTLSQRVLYG